MKKTIISIFTAVITLSSFSVLNASAYNGNKASEYARKYSHSYNSSYYNFDGSGGDCTNFVSQCLQAGGYSQDKEGTNYVFSGLNLNWERKKWYHKAGKTLLGKKTWDVSTTWANVTTSKPKFYYGLYQYLTDIKGNTAKEFDLNNSQYKNLIKEASVGDVIQLMGPSQKEHSIIVTKKTNNEIYYSGHSTSRRDHPFSSIIKDRSDGRNHYNSAYLIKVR